MARYVRRRMVSIQLSIAAGILGLLAGIGLGRGTGTPQIEADPVASKTLTIYGSNIADGTIRYQDLNKASIQKGLYLKSQVDRLFLKIGDADVRFNKLITNALGSYIKLGEADTRFVKLGALDGYLKLDALNGYLKLDAADARFLKLGALDGYVKLDALNGYLKIDALNGYLKLADADGRFLKLEDVDARMEKHLTDNGYLKTSAADARYVAGDGSVRTGSQVAGVEAKELLTVGKTMAVDDWQTAGARELNVKIRNLSAGSLDYASTAVGPQGETYHGTIDPGGSSTAILIGLLLPAVIQVHDGGDGSVHTITITAYDKAAGGGAQVTAQVLSSAPGG